MATQPNVQPLIGAGKLKEDDPQIATMSLVIVVRKTDVSHCAASASAALKTTTCSRRVRTLIP